jgi:hypothetical protein
VVARGESGKDITGERLGRATAVVTLLLNGAPNIFGPMVPLARLGVSRMNDEIFATLHAAAWLTARLAGEVGAGTGESAEAVLQRIVAQLQAELLD